MKTTFTLIIIAGLLYSCRKAPISIATPNAVYYVSSIKQYSSKIERKDSLEYDTSHNITRIIHYDYDSTSGPLQSDSTFMVFTYLNDSTPPVSYTLLGITHQLTYDVQNRIVMDSSTDGSGNKTNFGYGTDSLVYRNEIFIPSHLITVDSLFMTGENIAKAKLFTPSSTGIGSLAETFIYSNYVDANPSYHERIRNTIGPLLHFITYDYYYQTTLADILSSQMATSAVGSGTLANASLTAGISTDADGRVVQSQPYYYGFPYNGRIVFLYY